jgi:hypothetical protein
MTILVFGGRIMDWEESVARRVMEQTVKDILDVIELHDTSEEKMDAVQWVSGMDEWFCFYCEVLKVDPRDLRECILMAFTHQKAIDALRKTYRIRLTPSRKKKLSKL